MVLQHNYILLGLHGALTYIYARSVLCEDSVVMRDISNILIFPFSELQNVEIQVPQDHGRHTGRDSRFSTKHFISIMDRASMVLDYTFKKVVSLSLQLQTCIFFVKCNTPLRGINCFII